MNRLGRYALVATGTIALLTCSCSTDASKDQLNAKAIQLQRARFIELAISDRPGTATYHTYYISGSVLEKVRSWIRDYAWPPIDPNKTGAVAPRGYFTVFEGASAASSSFRIYVFGATARKLSDIHVSNEDWQKLVTLIPYTQ